MVTENFKTILNQAVYNIERPEKNIINLKNIINHNEFSKLDSNDQISYLIRYAHECYVSRKFKLCWKYYKYKLLSKIKISKYPNTIKNNKGTVFFLENLNQIIKNEKLLIWDDGGYGDIFLHSRFLNIIPKNIDYKIKLRKNLNWIFRKDIKRKIIQDDTKEKFKYHVSFMMLEPLFKFDINKFIFNFDYLISPDNPDWKKYFQSFKNNKKIGLVLDTETTKLRNINFEKIEILIKSKPKIQFFLIDQKPSRESKKYEKINSNLTILSKIDRNFPFYDTYSILNYLDALISVDTAVSHLAGYLQLKTYLLLHKPNHYYWGLTDKKSIYYKNHKIIRQKKIGDWSNVIKELIKLL